MHPLPHGGCLRPDPNRRRRREPSFLPDDVVVRGKGLEDDGGGGSLAQFGLTSLSGGVGLCLGFRLDVWTEWRVQWCLDLGMVQSGRTGLRALV